MDNPYYFCQDTHLPLQPSFLASLKVNDSEARKALDQNLAMLNSRLESRESPSVKLMKRCSLKKFFGKNSKLKRSQSLTHEKDSNFAVERSKSFSSRSSAADARTWTSANPKSAAVSQENTRRSWGSPTYSSVCVQRQRSIQVDDITILNSQMASVALMQQRTRPPLPPATRSPMNVRQDDLIQLRQKHKLKMSTPPPPHLAKYCDVAVVYSSRCQVSGEWARFIVALMKQQGYQNVVSQCIESEFLDDNANAPKVFQAKSQIVILGQAFLDWLYVHPGSHIGTLFKDGTKVIGLLLGVTKDQVKAEHRAELLTFAVWKFLFAIRAKEHESLAKSLINAVSSMMPPSKSSSGNISASYVLPRPLKKFKMWSATEGVKSHEKILLFLNDKIQSSDLDKLQVTIEVLHDSIPRLRAFPESVALVNESSLEITLPEINGNGIKLSLEIGGFKWHPDCNSTIKVVANQLHELDRTLSQYLEQLHSGFIQLDGKDRNCPTLLHFAAKQQMTQVVTQLLKLPDLGGLQMSSILNQDGLSPRDLAVQAGNLELAKLLKNPDKPKQNYELPVLKAKSEDLYDIPRQVENCYVVPPPPRPVLKSKSQIKEAYLPMQPTRKLSSETETEKPEKPKLIIDEPPRPQSRQEFMKSLFKDEVGSEDSNSSSNGSGKVKAENSDGCEIQPKSPLIVKPFPMIVPQEKKSLEESTECQLQEIELKIQNKQMNFKTLDEKFRSWQNRPDVIFADGTSEVESLKKRWMDLFEKFPNPNEDKRKDKSWKFFKKSKKYSTLPSMPFRKKSNSTNSIPEGSTLKDRFKTSSLSESEWSPSSSTEKIDKKNTNYDNVSVMEPGDVRISD